MADNCYDHNTALSSTLDLVSKLDKEKYNWTLKCDDGNIKLEISDRNKSQSPTPKPEASHGNSRTQPSFSRGFAEGQGRGRGRRDLSRGVRTANLESKITSANSKPKNNSTNLESKVKDKYKSPSELRRSHKRLRAYLHENYSKEKECQTSRETSECSTQVSVVTSSPPRLDSIALKVVCIRDLVEEAVQHIRIIELQRKALSQHEELLQSLNLNLKIKEQDHKAQLDNAAEELRIAQADRIAQDKLIATQEEKLILLSQAVESLTTQVDQQLVSKPSSGEIQPQPDLTSCWNPPCDKTGCTKKCTACKIAVYCSRVCQKTHWKQHKSDSCVDANARN